MHETKFIARKTGAEKSKIVSMPYDNKSSSRDSSIDKILYLQRTTGNRAVQDLFRSGTLLAKLRISQPGDKYEHEADWVAQVMQMPEPSMQPKTGMIRSYISGSPVINRQAAKTYIKSDLKLLLRDIIGLEWMVQSGGNSPIKLTESLVALIQKATTLSEADIRLLWMKPPKTSGDVLKNIDHSLPDTISEALFKELQDIKLKAIMSGKLHSRPLKKM